jgi:hypothetical protein
LTRLPFTYTANARGSRSWNSSGEELVVYETIPASHVVLGVFNHKSALSAGPETPEIGFRITASFDPSRDTAVFPSPRNAPTDADATPPRYVPG